MHAFYAGGGVPRQSGERFHRADSKKGAWPLDSPDYGALSGRGAKVALPPGILFQTERRTPRKPRA
jgi:hypothetical protein